MGRSSRFSSAKSISPGPPSYAEKVGEQTGITNAHHPLSTIRSTKNSVIGMNEQRPPWHNRFNVTPAPGSYRLASDFGYNDIKNRSTFKKSFPGKSTLETGQIEALCNTATNTMREVPEHEPVLGTNKKNRRGNKMINSTLVALNDEPRKRKSMD